VVNFPFVCGSLSPCPLSCCREMEIFHHVPSNYSAASGGSPPPSDFHKRYRALRQDRMIPLGRAFWSLKLQEEAKEMAMGSAFRQAADEEARAEVEVLKNRLEKTSQLNKKIAASLARLEATGKSLDEAVKPISGSTQRSQVLINSMHATHFTFCATTLIVRRYRWSSWASRAYQTTIRY
jgi:hypothetical protein